ncbi:MAG TPA: GAF domain-containing protein, partial [Casimicrobiaceae bacterium]|nr:GAF domain-containing protein [Casimicrobiaceae bacterium]
MTAESTQSAGSRRRKAPSRSRTQAATRKSELAIINSIQQGMADSLEFQAIVDLVGDKVRELFDSADMGIQWLDEPSGTIQFLYAYEHGKRLHLPPMKAPVEKRFYKLLGARQTVRWNSHADYPALELLAVEGTDASRSGVAIPIFVGDRLRGIIILENYQRDNAYTESDEFLLGTIATGMGVALENARLFSEVQKSNAQLSESLERESASNDILRVIAESPTDIKPVLDTIARRAARLSGSDDAVIGTRDGDLLIVAAHHGDIPMIPVGRGIEVNRGSVVGRSMIEGRTVQAIHSEPGAKSEYPEGDVVAKRYGYRVTCSVPMMREGEAIGAIGIRRIQPEVLSEKEIAVIQSFADQAAIAIGNVRLFNETQRLLKETEQRNAELAIINAVQHALAGELSLQGVYDIVGERIREVFADSEVGIRIYDPESNVVHYPYAYYDGGRREIPSEPLGDSGFGPHVIRTRRTLVINENFERARGEFGSYLLTPGVPMAKSQAIVPLLVGDQARGLIQLSNLHREHAYADSDVRLLQTLAGSMSAALENARLFNETQRLLKETEQRSSELAVINSIQQGMAAKLDFQAIVDLVGDKLRELFRTGDMSIRWRDEKDVVHQLYVYEHGKRLSLPPAPYKGESKLAKALLAGRPVVLRNQAEADAMGIKTTPGTDSSLSSVFVPIFVGDRLTASITLESFEREDAYGETEVHLLSAVAASMGLALRNAQLFNETKTALERQTLTGEVLQVISSSVADTAPVFDKILDSCQHLFATGQLGIFVVGDEGMVHVGAWRGSAFESVVRAFPKSLDETATGLVLRQRGVLHVADTADAHDLPATVREVVDRVGDVTLAWAPMLWEERGVGSICAMRQPPDPFSDNELALLRTFADQAVIAIQNARLFNETNEALARQTATTDILRVISGSPTDVQPVFDSIVVTASQLLRCDMAFVQRRDARTFSVAAGATADRGLMGASEVIGESFPIDPAANFPSRAIVDKATLHLPDWSKVELPEHEARIRERFGLNSALYVPLVIEGECVGVLGLGRMQAAAFTETEIAQAESFRDQAVIAIRNTRLFNETKEALERQTATAEILKVISRSPTDVKPVFEAVAERAGLLCHAEMSRVWLLDGDELRAMTSYGPIYPANSVGERLPLRRTSVGGRAALERRTIHVEDLVPLIDSEYPDVREIQARYGFRTVLNVPLLREGETIGVISVARNTVRPFASEEIALVQTFADQAVIAIENVRLFNETKEALGRQTATAEVLKVISESPTDVQPVFDIIAERAARLTGAQFGLVFRFDGEWIHAASSFGVDWEAVRDLLRVFPMRADGPSIAARAI